MKPHSKTGERHVILMACLQAVRDKGSRRSNAETVVMMTDPADRVAVTAADQSIWAVREGNNLHFYYETADKQTKMGNVITYRRPSTAAVSVIIGNAVPGIK